MTLTDVELLAAFRDASLPAAAFRHREHVRVAWLYLEEACADAARRFARDLQAFATAHGATTKYDDALTRAWLAKIDARRGAAATWEDFVAANPDLLVFRREGGSGTR